MPMASSFSAFPTECLPRSSALALVALLVSALVTSQEPPRPRGLDDASVLLVVGHSATGAATRDAAGEAALLLGISSVTATRSSRASATSNPWGPRHASWFDNFESTQTGENGEFSSRNFGDWHESAVFDPAALRHSVWDPAIANLPGPNNMEAVPSKWFHEAASGGPEAAWQTHYPAVGDRLLNPGAGQVRMNGPWRRTPEGWVFEHGAARQSSQGPTKSSWFDASVGEYDAYGRRPPPDKGSVEWLLQDEDGYSWVERSVNTTVTCAERGCLGSANLQAFDGETEEAANCRLNIGVHPTDFDNDHSRESIEFWRVNGYTVRSGCSVWESGCAGVRPLVSCLRDFSVSRFLDSNGSLLIEGQLNRMVDECPYGGNLLSGVAQVTCLVRQKADMRESPSALVTPAPPGLTQEMISDCKHSTAVLRCSEPGCIAEASFRTDPVVAYFGGTYKMNISIVVTDFDETESDESIEFVKIKGRGVLAERATPSGNPCHNGQPKSKGPREVFQVITDLDVTEDVKREMPMVISAKISDMVDECASDGYLLDGLVEVTCTPPTQPLGPPP